MELQINSLETRIEKMQERFGVAFLYSGSLWSSLYCGVSSLWVGLDGWLVKVSWLGKLVSVFWWVELDSSLWSAMKCPVMSYDMSVGLE